MRRPEIHLYPDDPEVLQQAAAAINPLRLDSAAPVTTADNRVKDPTADIEIRHGHDGWWYPFAATGHDWQLIALPAGRQPSCSPLVLVYGSGSSA
ncbi:hypothetical protein [Nonomuraea jiangxiensis]|uniref:Uncharacterized protein n=1 Tax=Nonomuraea jiangxiensis TaxID=633440 RepID=A0A1G9VIJ5_9ACTN|nr:hypothetical protein [Nonomuraea jiangxiensis]SDM71979.1 hypothetical protein SAMN05421869_15338 [Nonomuraea jiangxiensis]